MGKFLKQYQIFYKKAKADYKAAQNLFVDFEAGDTDLDLDIIFFHLQQCVEKGIKAVLAFHSIEFPKTHDLELLFGISKNHGISFPQKSETLIDLSDYAVEMRYSVIHDDLEDVQKYFHLIDDFLKQVDLYF